MISLGTWLNITGLLQGNSPNFSRNRSGVGNKKAVLSQRWPRNAPHISLLWKFSGFPEYATATFPKIFHGLLFWLTLWMCLQNLKSVALPAPEIIGGTQKFGQSLAMPTPSIPPPKKKNPIYLPYRLFICVKIVHSFSRYFRLQFWVGVANSQSCGRGCRRGSEVVPFERALVSSCMPSIITFPSILRVSEILPLLFSRTPLFLTLPLISPKFPHVSLGAGGSPFRYKERRCWVNCLCN